MEHTLTPESFVGHRLDALRRWLRNPSIYVPLLVFVVARVLTLAVGMMAVQAGPVPNVWSRDPIFVESLQGRQLNSPLTPFVEPWHRWDTGWYLKIAVKGYAADDGSIIFQPLYPGLMALVGFFVGDRLLGGLIVSSVACVIFLMLLYRLIRAEFDSDSLAANTLIVLAVFPTAFYMQAAYTESTFLALVVGTLLAARNCRWWLAGLLAAFATLTRIQGWVLFFPIGWMAFAEAPRFWQLPGISWSERVRQALPRLIAMGLGPLMVIAYQGYLWLAGLGSVTDAYQKFWAMGFMPPWSPVIDVIGRMAAGKAGLTEILGLVALGIIVALLLMSIRRLPVFYHLYLWPTLVLILLRYYTPTLLNGTMRYVLDFFPAFITLGMILANHRLLRLFWIVIGVALQITLVYLFARWMWIA